MNKETKIIGMHVIEQVGDSLQRIVSSYCDIEKDTIKNTNFSISAEEFLKLDLDGLQEWKQKISNIEKENKGKIIERQKSIEKRIRETLRYLEGEFSKIGLYYVNGQWRDGV